MHFRSNKHNYNYAFRGNYCGNSFFGPTTCKTGFKCCSTKDHTCCPDGYVCTGSLCLSIGAIAGIIVGALSGLSFLVSILAYICIKLAKKSSVQPQPQTLQPAPPPVVQYSQ